MKRYVDFYGIDAQSEIYFGYIGFDLDHGTFVTLGTNERHSEMLARILQKPIILADRPVFSEQEPAKFIDSLFKKYRSAYFRATQAIELRGDEGFPVLPKLADDEVAIGVTTGEDFDPNPPGWLTE